MSSAPSTLRKPHKKTLPQAPKTSVIDNDSLQNELLESMFDSESRVSKRIQSLESSGLERELRLAKNEMVNRLSALKHDFPNFSEVIDYLTDSVILAISSRDKYLQFDPIALDGPPGVGKTEFCNRLAEIMNLECKFIACSSINSDFSISGLDRGYTSAYPGEVAQFFWKHKTANPLFILDEFEKPSKDPRGTNSNGTFHGPFFSLLEPNSAHDFQDNYFRVRFDASYINWVMTVNNFYLLPIPIQSRLTRFNIEVPGPDQSRNVIQSIYRSAVSALHTKRGLRLNENLSEEQIRQLAALPPREVRKALDTMIKKAVRYAYLENTNGRAIHKTIISLRDEHLPAVADTGDRGIGFLANL